MGCHVPNYKILLMMPVILTIMAVVRRVVQVQVQSEKVDDGEEKMVVQGVIRIRVETTVVEMGQLSINIFLIPHSLHCGKEKIMKRKEKLSSEQVILTILPFF